jgi:uncharacterized protein with PhoU and TrkA domain
MLTKLFYSRTVASITASLSSMVKDLEAHAEAKLLEAEQHNNAINEIQTLYELASSEVTKAKAAATKIAALFS